MGTYGHNVYNIYNLTLCNMVSIVKPIQGGLHVIVGYIGENNTYVHDEFTVSSSKEINDWMDKLESHGAKEAHFFC